MSAAERYLPHYTVADYAHWEGDWELWAGIAVAMSPGPFGKHQRIAKRLLLALEAELQKQACNAESIYEMDWIVRDDTVVRPDLVVLCDGIPERHIETTPALVAEVLSDSTRQRDQTFKRELYDEQGVSVYLLIDPEPETLEVYQRDPAGKWKHEQVSESIVFSICDHCTIRLDRTRLFDK